MFTLFAALMLIISGITANHITDGMVAFGAGDYRWRKAGRARADGRRAADVSPPAAPG